jgi:hypothetical protein
MSDRQKMATDAITDVDELEFRLRRNQELGHAPLRLIANAEADGQIGADNVVELRRRFNLNQTTTTGQWHLVAHWQHPWPNTCAIAVSIDEWHDTDTDARNRIWERTDGHYVRAVEIPTPWCDTIGGLIFDAMDGDHQVGTYSIVYWPVRPGRAS